jgi:hypothetical protein
MYNAYGTMGVYGWTLEEKTAIITAGGGSDKVLRGVDEGM